MLIFYICIGLFFQSQYYGILDLKLMNHYANFRIFYAKNGFD